MDECYHYSVTIVLKNSRFGMIWTWNGTDLISIVLSAIHYEFQDDCQKDVDIPTTTVGKLSVY